MPRTVWITVLAVLLASLAAAQVGAPGRVDQNDRPRLEDAIHLEARIDKDELYLGEPLTLTLEYWELNLRGIRVQRRYRNTGVTLPATEGFYTGRLEETERAATRNGALYTVTAYQQELFPTAAGERRIGSWRWTGTVRGHTASGARSIDMDLATDPIDVRVRPLPDPLATFEGAVGDYALELEFETRELTQGVPVSLTVSVSGRGNPGVIGAPALPGAPWYDLGDPEEEITESGQAGAFVKAFRYPFLPVGAGEQTFPPVSLTYFSPRDERYRIARTAAVPLQITATGAAEELVVIGGRVSGDDAHVETVREGHLPIVTSVDAFRIGRGQWDVWPLVIALPPVAFLAFFAATGGLDRVRRWRPRRLRAPAVEARLAAVAEDPRPYDALNRTARAILAERMGRDMAGLTPPEIEDALTDYAGPAVAGAVAEVLRASDRHRYGNEAGRLAPLIGRTRDALERVPARGGHAR